MVLLLVRLRRISCATRIKYLGFASVNYLKRINQFIPTLVLVGSPQCKWQRQSGCGDSQFYRTLGAHGARDAPYFPWVGTLKDNPNHNAAQAMLRPQYTIRIACSPSEKLPASHSIFIYCSACPSPQDNFFYFLRSLLRLHDGITSIAS